MTDEPNRDPGAGDAPDDVLLDDELIQQMRAALDEAATVRPSTPQPAAAPDRRRWLAIAAAGVLIAAGIAALAVRMSGSDETTAPEPVPAPGTELVGVAMIIDDGDGPQLAHELLASLPPQGGDIPIANFDWSLVDGEESLNGTTWSDGVEVTGTWDGTAFTVTRPTTPAPVAPTPLGEPTPGCDEAAATAAAGAVSALDWKALHLATWNPETRGGQCGADVTAWFDAPRATRSRSTSSSTR
jgi:hypothetical protein